jgi:hypothetical protein
MGILGEASGTGRMFFRKNSSKQDLQQQLEEDSASSLVHHESHQHQDNDPHAHQPGHFLDMPRQNLVDSQYM